MAGIMGDVTNNNWRRAANNLSNEIDKLKMSDKRLTTFASFKHQVSPESLITRH